MRVPVALLVASVAVGCQCMPCTDHYADVIDCISDYECHGEKFYHPELDLQRIGHADWCRSRINRWLCPCSCQRAAYIEAHRDRSKEVGQLWNQTVVKRSTPAAGPAPGMDDGAGSEGSRYDGRNDRVPPEPAPEQQDLDLNMQPDGTRAQPAVPPAPGAELPSPEPEPPSSTPSREPADP